MTEHEVEFHPQARMLRGDFGNAVSATTLARWGAPLAPRTRKHGDIALSNAADRDSIEPSGATDLVDELEQAA